MLFPNYAGPKHERGLQASIPPYTFLKKQEPERGISAGVERPHIDAEMVMGHYYKNSNMIYEGLNQNAPRVWDPYNGLRPPERKIEGFRPREEHFAYGTRTDVTPVPEIPAVYDHGDKADVNNRYPQRRHKRGEDRHNITYYAQREYEVPIISEIPTLGKTKILPRTTPYNPKIENSQIKYQKPILRPNKSIHASPRIYSQPEYVHEIRPSRQVYAPSKKKLKRRVISTARPRYATYADYQNPIQYQQPQFRNKLNNPNISVNPIVEPETYPGYRPNVHYTQDKVNNPNINLKPTIEPETDYNPPSFNPPPPTMKPRKQVEVNVSPDLDADIEEILNEDIVNLPEKKHVYAAPYVTKDSGILSEVRNEVRKLREKKQSHTHINPKVVVFTEIMEPILRGFTKDIESVIKKGPIPFNIPVQPIPEIYSDPRVPQVIIEELEDDYIDPPVLNAGSNMILEIEPPKKENLVESTKSNQTIEARDDNNEMNPSDTLNSLNVNL